MLGQDYLHSSVETALTNRIHIVVHMNRLLSEPLDSFRISDWGRWWHFEHFPESAQRQRKLLCVTCEGVHGSDILISCLRSLKHTAAN